MADEARVGYASIDMIADELERSIRLKQVNGRYQGDWSDVVMLGYLTDYLNPERREAPGKDKTYK